MPNVAALIDDIGVPQVAHHEHGEADISEYDGKEHADGTQMVYSLLRRGHTTAVVNVGIAAIGLLIASGGIEWRSEFLSASDHAFIFLTAPIAVRWPCLMTRPMTRRPDLVVIQSVTKRVRHDEGEGDPDQEGGPPFMAEGVGVITVSGFVGDVDTESTDDHQVDAQSDDMCSVTGSG